MLNRITIMGRMVKDAELRQTSNGVSVTSFTIACDRDFKGGDTSVDFVDVTAWRSAAEFVCKYMGKGRMAIVDGRLEFREWTDKEGNKRRNAYVVAENVYFGDTKRQEAQDTSNSYAPSGFGTTGGDFAEINDESDLPF